MRRLLASEASRAVLASDVTPPLIWASSGADMLAAPLTEIAGGGAVCAITGVASSASAAIAQMPHPSHFSGT
jgi:hypothetical protein